MHPAQKEVFDSKARFKVVCCGRRWGKTLMGILACIVVAAKGGNAQWIAPTFTVADLGWKPLKAMCKGIEGIDIAEGDRTITFPSGGTIQVKSGDRPDLLRGVSLDLVVFDECADIREEAWTEAIRPALADRRGKAIFIGTPRGKDNWFYGLFEKGLSPDFPSWTSWQMPTSSNPYIPVEEIEEARQDMHPILFGQEFLAEFVVTGGTVFHAEWYRECLLQGSPGFYDRENEQYLVLRNGEEQVELCTLRSCLRFGVADLAISTKTSADYTVLASVARTPQNRMCVIDVVRKRMESPDTLSEIRQQMSKWGLSFVAAEAVAYQTSLIQNSVRQGLAVRKITPDKDKLSRAYAAAPFMEQGRMWTRGGQLWTPEWKSEILSFPLSKHDDQVDVWSYIAWHIQNLVTNASFTSW